METNENESVEKVVQGRQLSMRDRVLTPPHKMEAERQRMQRPTPTSENRRHEEEDCQKASLGSQVLTPQRKMSMAWQEAKERSKSAN